MRTSTAQFACWSNVDVAYERQAHFATRGCSPCLPGLIWTVWTSKADSLCVAQPDMHGSFEAEIGMLRKQFVGMGGSRGAYVLGDALRGLQWHVFVADASGSAAAGSLARTSPPPPLKAATYTLEVCMTGLCPVKAAQFVRGSGFVSSAAITAASGIRALLPGADIDDYVFDPCGYSMNGMEVSMHSRCNTLACYLLHVGVRTAIFVSYRTL